MGLRYPFNPQAPERYPKRRSGFLASIESRVTPRTKKPISAASALTLSPTWIGSLSRSVIQGCWWEVKVWPKVSWRGGHYGRPHPFPPLEGFARVPSCMVRRCINWAPPGGIGAVHQRGKHRRRKDQCNDSNTPEQVQALKPPSQRPEQLFVLSLSSRCRPVAPLGEHVSQTI